MCRQEQLSDTPLGEGGCERSEQTDKERFPTSCRLPAPSSVTCGDSFLRPGEAIIRKNDFREDGLQTLSKRHILCYDKREELLPGGNSPGAAEYIQIYYNPFRPVFPQKPADFVQKEFAS